MAAVCLTALGSGPWCIGELRGQSPEDRRGQYLEFVRASAAQLERDRPVVASLEDWRVRRLELRGELENAWGGFPDRPCPLAPRLVGQLEREGYRVEKIVFQTRPTVWMTANAYIPSGDGPFPAVLCVHGHWRGAKQDPVVQARCLGLVRQGFVVLSVDAFGAGERGIGKQLGEYHGEMTAATLLPVGLPLSGLQVYENQRAVDYLRSRPDVDGDRIGITGASGGGNQTMYAGAMDERLSAVVPVCSVGNYQAYLGAACCLCEVVPGALRFTEEWGVLARCAPRALMVVNATRDAPQFSVAQAEKSLAATRAIYGLYSSPEQVRHTIFESPHDYSQAMRESMYGWMLQHVARRGDGSPVPEPTVKPEDPELLRCFPGESRPDDFVTIPRFAAAEGRRLLALRSPPVSAEDWSQQANAKRMKLQKLVDGQDGHRPPSHIGATVSRDDRGRTIELQPEPGLQLTVRQEPESGERVALVLDLDGGAQAAAQTLTKELQKAGWSIVTVDLRATGKLAHPSDKIGRAPDHNSAEWGLWIGRPLLGQWLVDVRTTLDAVLPADGSDKVTTAVVGFGPAGLVAVCSAALDSRLDSVVAVGMLTSYLTESPYQGQRLGIMVPGILREIGDISDLAALVAPRRVVVAGGVLGDGTVVDMARLRTQYTTAESIWPLLRSERNFHVLSSDDTAAVVTAMRSAPP